jgi:hypothetical protein
MQPSQRGWPKSVRQPWRMTNSPALGAEGFAKGKTGPMGGVEIPSSKPKFEGESVVARRPTQGDTLGNPFLNETANPNRPTSKGVKALRLRRSTARIRATLAKADATSDRSWVAVHPRWWPVSLVSRYPVADTAARTTLRPADSPAVAGGAGNGRQPAAPGSTIGKTLARPRTPMKPGDF